jgi:hypothetical protein
MMFHGTLSGVPGSHARPSKKTFRNTPAQILTTNLTSTKTNGIVTAAVPVAALVAMIVPHHDVPVALLLQKIETASQELLGDLAFHKVSCAEYSILK